MRYLWSLATFWAFISTPTFGGELVQMDGWKPKSKCEIAVALHAAHEDIYQAILASGMPPDLARALELKLRNIPEKHLVQLLAGLVKQHLKSVDETSDSEIKKDAKKYILRDLLYLNAVLGDNNTTWTPFHSHVAVLQIESAIRSQLRLSSFFKQAAVYFAKDLLSSIFSTTADALVGSFFAKGQEAQKPQAPEIPVAQKVMAIMEYTQIALIPLAVVDAENMATFKLNQIESIVDTSYDDMTWVNDFKRLVTYVKEKHLDSRGTDKFNRLLDFTFEIGLLWNQMSYYHSKDGTESNALMKAYVNGVMSHPERIETYIRQADSLMENTWPAIIDIQVNSAGLGPKEADFQYRWRQFQDSAARLRLGI